MAAVNKETVKRGWHWDHVTEQLQAYNNGVEIIQYPLGNVYYVDSTNGSDNNNGASWATAFATIQKAFDSVTTLANRGRHKIYVAPGGYTEDLITPLNTVSPFGSLIAVNPTPDRSFGATWITASTAATPCLTIRARGWFIYGFEFDALADAGCVLLDGATANSSAQGTQIQSCLFVGQNQGLYGIDVTKNGAPYTHIRDCHFSGFTSGSTAGDCIRCSSSATDQPRFWLIRDCSFVDSDNLINMNPRGFKESQIRDCAFYATGANQSPAQILNNGGGNGCLIGPNNFLGGDYDEGSGYKAGSNENWRGNWYQDMVGTVSGGNSTAQANPAS